MVDVANVIISGGGLNTLIKKPLKADIRTAVMIPIHTANSIDPNESPISDAITTETNEIFAPRERSTAPISII
jgi:hypothetical protein